MAFSNRKLPSKDINVSQLNYEIEAVLMMQWESGYKDGVESCAIMLDIIANTLVEHGNKELADMLSKLGQSFREQVEQCVD